MDILFHKLGVSVKHLTVLHETLKAESAEYRAENEKIEALGIDDFGRQLYAGGKVGNNIERQMILADIFQYIFVGRGYFAAVESPEKMKKFIELLFRTANLLILQENLSVEPELRRKVIESLEAAIPENDFIEPGYDDIAQEIEDLKNYGGWIVGKHGEEFENIFDSLLPKRLALAVELIVFAMLLLKKYGYIVPLLMTQRLIRGGSHAEGNARISYLAPPDFLLLREKGQVFGIEVGSGKDDQNAKFSLVTSIPLFSVRLGDHRQPQPYRCGKCGHWIIYSGFVIRGLIDGTISTDNEHTDADVFLDNPPVGVTEADLAYYGEAIDHSGNTRKLRYHYSCVKDQEVVRNRIARETRHHTNGLILPVPFVKGLELLKED
jgi:hypothetical protein